MFFEIAQVLPHIWITFKGKFVTKNLKKLPNLVALRVKKNENTNLFRSKVAAASNSVTRRGSGCGSVGIAVSSNSRGLWFKSIHPQKFILNTYSQLFWKDENEENQAGNGPFFKKNSVTRFGNFWNILKQKYFHPATPGQLPSTLFTLLSFIVKVVLFLFLQCEKKNKNKQKSPGLAHIYKLMY